MSKYSNKPNMDRCPVGVTLDLHVETQTTSALRSEQFQTSRIDNLTGLKATLSPDPLEIPYFPL